ncbi:hypothetical protein BGX30_004373 [Mortierella sp. GBA39]|nr:hypothetical protein BGX30_004373 [Mortierella sp. GBA39]
MLPVEQGRQPLNKEVTEKKVDASTNAVLTIHNWMEDTPMDLELDNVVHQEQQQQPIKPSGEVLSAIKKDAEKIVGTVSAKDDNPLQDPQGTSMVASQPDVAVALGPQLHYHHPQLQQPKEPKPVATTTTATAEVNIPSLLQDFKSWIEAETKKHQDQSALLQSLFAKNTLLESKLEAHTTRWDDEVKKQEAYRSISTMTHSCEFDLASLKERTLAQDLKISQLEAHLESRIRHSLENDLAVLRNELQEERVENLTKDLELKRAEAMEVMAKARAEMWDARQMVSEAREERANAMERAARAEADNQMLLRVINELQGTGWGVSGQAQAQGLQGQDAGIHHTGLLSSSVHPRPQIDHPHYPLTTTAAGSSTFMRFGTSMRQTYSSSSTESLASAEAAGAGGAARAAAADPSIHRMEVISVKLENDYIARLNTVIPNPDLDPDMTEDDEGRTDTDHDATDEE